MDLRIFWQTLASVFILSTLASCSNQAHFGSSGPTKAGQSHDAGEAVATPTIVPTTQPTSASHSADAEESFDLSTHLQAGKLDIIWTIDNSGSMGEEAAKVRSNFQQFIDTLGSSTNLRLNLISSAALPTGSTDTGVRLNAAAISAGHHQLDVTIGSTNLLAITAAAICPLSSTDLTTTSALKICGQPLTTSEVSAIESSAQATKAREGLVGWLRPEAKKIIVFVTDDDAMGIVDSHFIKVLQSQKGFESSTVFAFRGVASATGCSISRPGAVYNALSSKTGGDVYDICLPDWSGSFTKLNDHATLIANSDIELGHDNIIEIVEVRVGTKVLAKGDYKRTNKTLSITPSLLQGASGKIVIRYKYRV